MSASFDPGRHRPVAPRPLAELTLGEEFPLPSRTVTEAHFAAFQALSGDNHPIHYDREYCRLHGHPELLAHGLQVLAYTAAGAGSLPWVFGAALVGFVEQSCRFLRPVYVGDTLYPTLRIEGLKPQRTTTLVTVSSAIHNQRRELVLEGIQAYLLRQEAPTG